MKELDQLVENFFQPKRDTLGLDQLVEMVEEATKELKAPLQSQRLPKQSAKKNASACLYPFLR